MYILKLKASDQAMKILGHPAQYSVGMTCVASKCVLIDVDIHRCT
jgi:hypothetical protein